MKRRKYARPRKVYWDMSTNYYAINLNHFIYLIADLAGCSTVITTMPSGMLLYHCVKDEMYKFEERLREHRERPFQLTEHSKDWMMFVNGGRVPVYGAPTLKQFSNGANEVILTRDTRKSTYSNYSQVFFLGKILEGRDKTAMIKGSEGRETVTYSQS